MWRTPVCSTLIALMALLTVAAPGDVLAQRAPGTDLDSQPVIRHQLLLRGSRHEVTADLGATLADAFARNWLLGASYQYYFYNSVGAGLSVSGNLCMVMGGVCKTSLAEDVESTHPRDIKLEGVSAFSFIVTPFLSIIPMNGKIGVFKRHVMHYDTHLVAGFALARTGSLGDSGGLDKTSLGPMIGIGQRFFIDDGMAVTISVKDLILSRALNETESGEAASEEYDNNFILSVGVSFYFPSEAQTSR